jgi:dephospho-CoA kinase
MLKIGLTGSIGSGKSTIAKVFELLGVPVYFTDIEAKRILYEPDVMGKVIERYGEYVLSNDGTLDKNKLASKVFNDTAELQWLNSLIHPKVRRDFMNWVQSNTVFSYIIQESAIMLETGFSSFFDKIVVVTCPEDERIHRVLSRDKMTIEQVKERMENQWSEELKITKADYIIVNDDRSLAVPQVIGLHKLFTELALDKRCFY